MDSVGVYEKIDDSKIILWVPKGVHHEFGYCESGPKDLVVIPAGWEEGLRLAEPCRIVLDLKEKRWWIYCEHKANGAGATRGIFDCSISVPAGKTLPVYNDYSGLRKKANPA